MISGYNNDVIYDGVTYHVQTEDKGVKTPLILSLVYMNGTILASKRSKYDDLVESGFDEKVLEERLQRQHKLMCAAVKTGRIEDLKQMTLRNAGGQDAGEPIPKPSEPVAVVPDLPPLVDEPSEIVEATVEVVGEPDVPVIAEPIPKPDPAVMDVPLPSILESESEIEEPPQKVEAEVPGSNEITETKDVPETVWEMPMIEDVEIVEDDDFFEDGFVLSPDAIKIVDEFAASEAGEDGELKIKFLADYTFKAGDKKNVNLLVCRGNKDKEVENASVMIKVLGSAFRPIIFHAKTDKHGVATAFVKLPLFRSGRAAILIRASVGGEEAELRRVIENAD